VIAELTPQEVLDHPEDYKKIGEREHDLLHHQSAELYWQRTLTGIYKKKRDRTQAPVSCPAPVPPSTLQLDETPIRYLKPGNGKTKQGYLWVMRNPATGEVYYHWETTRGKDGLKRTLGWDEDAQTLDYRGTIQCDGYSAYASLAKELEGIKLGSCLAHIRRKFLKDESLTKTHWGPS